ncbi:TRAP transporter small permease subunit [Nocardioides sp. NPDC051685]|uniref:TRAP transporter small permease subunit n=1 Tax=Nocardioides sp. NPDC051685 TaxID=3364334 RepID=UPI0037972E0B
MTDEQSPDSGPEAAPRELATHSTAAETKARPGWLRVLQVIDVMSIACAAVGGVVLVAMMCTVIADVTRRTLSNNPLDGTLDLTQFAYMPTVIALGLGYALLRSDHIRVNLLTGSAGPRTQRILEVLGMAFTLGTAAFLMQFGAQKAQMAQQFDESSVGVDWLPIWPYRWVVVVGLAVLGFQAIAQLVRAVAEPDFTPSDEGDVASAIEDEEPLLDNVDGRIAVSLEVRPR